MARQRKKIAFTEAAVRRAVQGALKAGLPIAGVQVDAITGTILLIPETTESVAPSQPTNPWDD